MTVQELYELFKDFKQEFKSFKDNEFRHLENKIEKITYLLIATLVGLIANLVLMILK